MRWINTVPPQIEPTEQKQRRTHWLSALLKRSLSFSEGQNVSCVFSLHKVSPYYQHRYSFVSGGAPPSTPACRWCMRRSFSTPPFPGGVAILLSHFKLSRFPSRILFRYTPSTFFLASPKRCLASNPGGAQDPSRGDALFASLKMVYGDDTYSSSKESKPPCSPRDPAWSQLNSE